MIALFSVSCSKSEEPTLDPIYEIAGNYKTKYQIGDQPCIGSMNISTSHVLKISTTKARNIPILLRPSGDNYILDTQYSDTNGYHTITGKLVIYQGEPTVLYITDIVTYNGIHQGYTYKYELDIWKP